MWTLFMFLNTKPVKDTFKYAHGSSVFMTVKQFYGVVSEYQLFK